MILYVEEMKNVFKKVIFQILNLVLNQQHQQQLLQMVNVVKKMENVHLVNVVVNMVGVVKLMIIVLLQKDVNLNLENVMKIILLLPLFLFPPMISVVKNMENVHRINAVVNTAGVVKLMITVLFRKDVNQNLENVMKIPVPPPPPHQMVNVVKRMENVHLAIVVVSMVGVVKLMTIVLFLRDVNLHLVNVTKFWRRRKMKNKNFLTILRS